MSSLIIEVCQVEKLEPHPHADRMKIATVKGWRTCVSYDPETDTAAVNLHDKVIFFPPDTVLPAEVANAPTDNPPGRLNVTKYLCPLPPDADGKHPGGGRVRAARMRNVASYGFIERLKPELGDDPNWPVGTDVAAYFQASKWEPPLRELPPEGLPDLPAFHRYTELENVGNFPGVIEPGREVVFTEKLHGKNTRVALINLGAHEGTNDWTYTAGSYDLRRKEYDDKGVRSEFWEPLTEQVQRMLAFLRDSHLPDMNVAGVVLFGELFGSGVQDMAYGLKNGKRGFRAFDIAVNGNFIDFDKKLELCKRFDVETVPVLYRGPFSMEVLQEFTDGPTTICAPGEAGRFKGREGIVATLTVEAFSPILNGRMIIKSVSVDYLARKGGTDSH